MILARARALPTSASLSSVPSTTRVLQHFEFADDFASPFSCQGCLQEPLGPFREFLEDRLQTGLNVLGPLRGRIIMLVESEEDRSEGIEDSPAVLGQ